MDEWNRGNGGEKSHQNQEKSSNTRGQGKELMVETYVLGSEGEGLMVLALEIDGTTSTSSISNCSSRSIYLSSFVPWSEEAVSLGRTVMISLMLLMST